MRIKMAEMSQFSLLTWGGFLLLVSVCLPAEGGEYGVTYPTAYQPYYEKPTYYEAYDIKTDYRDANQTRHCGIAPVVHRAEYGIEKERVFFGEYPWQVAIMDDYYNFKCSGGLISPRHVITSAYCVEKMDTNSIRVRVGEYDILTDKNYLETYKNYEITVCKKHPFYNIPKYGYDSQSYGSYDYDVVILELSYDVDFDVYPHVEPVCLPEWYYLSKTYYSEYSYGYGGEKKVIYQADKNTDGSDKGLECWVAGWQESPQEKITYQGKPEYKPQYGYSSYQPYQSYESYEYSRTLWRAKVHKLYDYTPAYSYDTPAYGYGKQSYGYQKSYKTENWEADYYYDACHADVGAPIFCLVPGKYEEEKNYPVYTPPPSYTPTYTPAPYTPYTPPYSSYQPQYPQSYNSYGYDSGKTKRAYDQYQAPASYDYQPTYQPTYQPAYTPPYYEPEYKIYVKPAEEYNREYRRAVLVGVVSYGTQCSYGYQDTKKITVTNVKDIIDWILNVVHTQPSCYAYTPTYTPPYSPAPYSSY